MNRLTVGGATIAVAAEGRGRWQATRLARRFSGDAGSPLLEITPMPLATAPETRSPHLVLVVDRARARGTLHLPPALTGPDARRRRSADPS